MQRVCLVIGGSLLAACATPRSAVLGQTAAALGAGRAEVALATGFNADFTSSNGSSTNGISFPVYEGNLQFGLSDQTGLNLHLSPAGLQPGLKVTLVSGEVALAILPEAGIGLATASFSPSFPGSSARETGFEFIGGAKFILSHSKGVYGGVGYDFQYVSISTDSPSNSPSYTSHGISLAIGYDFASGFLRLRPEFSMIISPSNKQSNSNSNLTDYYLLPTLTVALQTPKR